MTPAAAGDILALAIETKFPSTPSFTAANVTGGGVSTWNKAFSYLTIDGFHGQELWWGTVSTPGTFTLTVSFTSGATSGTSESASSLDVQEFRSSAGISTVWSVDTTGKVDTGVASTAPAYPTLTPTTAGELYFGYLAVPSSVNAGTTPGVVYQVDARGNQVAYDLGVSATVTPTASSSSQTFSSIGMLVLAANGTPPPVPSVSAVSPTWGPTGGGTTVTVSGSNFAAGDTVKFGSATATGVTVTSASSLTATSPAGSGTVDVTVTGSGGTSPTSTADRFTYLAQCSAPTVTSLSPTSGPSTGGTTVTITGTNFAPGDTVSFGLADSINVSVTSATSLTAAAPAGGGTVDVTVAGQGGTSTTTTSDQFTYTGTPPSSPRVMVIEMENESYGSIIGNSSLPYINGTLAAHYPVLQDNYAVGHPSLPNYLEITSGSTWGVTSDCAPGAGCQGQTNLPPQLDQKGISWAGYFENLPYAGYTGGDTGGDNGYGSQLYLQHHNPFVYFPNLAADLATHTKPFTNLMADLDAADPPSFVWITPNSLDDMHDGPLTTGDSWLSQEIPAIQATPWYQSGGHIVLTWDEGGATDSSGIAGGSGGHIPGFVISQSLYGAPSYTTTVDQAGMLGSIESLFGVPALNDAANSAHGTLGSELTGGPGTPPSVSAINPASGPVAGGTTVTVTGSNFAAGDTVKFGSVAATGVSVTGTTSLTAISPAGSGTVDVTVTGSGGTSATGPADQFTYTTTPPPSVSAISPTSGPVAGGTTVTVTGSNFAAGDTVKFGSAAATGVDITGATSLTAISPARPAGTAKLVQSASTPSGSGPSRTLSLPSAVTGGDGLVLLFSNTIQNAATVSSVSGGGVTWHRADQENDDTVTADLEIWYGLSSAGGTGTTTITVKLSKSTKASYSINASEWSGITGLDQHPAGVVNHTGSATATAPSIAPAGADELFVAAVGTKSSTSGSPGGGFTALAATRSDNGFGYLVATDNAAHQYSQALKSSATWDGVAVSFLTTASSTTAVDVTVTGPGGTSATSPADQFTYEP